MIIVHLSKRPDTEHGDAHVRLVVHEPKKRNQLDHSLVTPGSQVTHLAPEGTDLQAWLLENYAFKRDDPQPLYRLVGSHLNLRDGDLAGNHSLRVSIPQSSKQPVIHICALGVYRSEVDGIEVAQQVFGFYTTDCYAEFVNDNRHETVVYMLGTCKRLIEDSLTLHLHEQLTALGFPTLYEPKVTESWIPGDA